MSTKKTKRPGAGIYFLPFAVAVPVAAAAAAAFTYVWPTIHKTINIIVKLVVKA